MTLILLFVSCLEGMDPPEWDGSAVTCPHGGDTGGDFREYDIYPIQTSLTYGDEDGEVSVAYKCRYAKAMSYVDEDGDPAIKYWDSGTTRFTCSEDASGALFDCTEDD